MSNLRTILFSQEIERLQSKIRHYQGRVDRGSADDEDRGCLGFYSDLYVDLASSKSSPLSGPDDTGRFSVEDILVLTRDCELGQESERFIVAHVDGPYMTIKPEGNPGLKIHTGRDYKHLSLAGGDVSPYQRSVNRLSAR